MDLRKSLIRLAHTKPELREHLLPLLRTSQQEPFDPIVGDKPWTRASMKKLMGFGAPQIQRWLSQVKEELHHPEPSESTADVLEARYARQHKLLSLIAAYESALKGLPK